MRERIPRICLILLTVLSVVGCASPTPDPVTEVVSPKVIARGRALVHGLAACGYCHGEQGDPDAPLTGGRAFRDDYGVAKAANLTPHPGGLGSWSVAEIVRVMRGGPRPDGELLSTQFHDGYEWMSDRDLLAIVTYLRSLQPQGGIVTRRSIGSWDRYTTGFFERQKEVVGFVPAFSESYPFERGRYLVDHVARCGSCHTGPSTILSSAVYLGGGREISIPEGEKTAPDLTSTGSGSWSEQELVSYLRTARTPSGRVVDTRFCPVPFFSVAEDSELAAIAHYIKTLK